MVEKVQRRMSGHQGLRQVREAQIAHHAEVEVPDFPRIEKVLNVLRKAPAGRLLDVGYSKGSFSDYLAKVGWECTGLDLNEHHHLTVKTIQCDLNEGLPVESEGYDAVTAGEVIEHILDEGSFLEECHRVLKRDGILVLTTPNLAFLLNRFLVLFGRTPMFVYAPYHYHFHIRKTLVSLVEQHGFSVEKVISSHVLFSRRMHFTGRIFEWLGDLFPTFGAHLIVFARKR
jgi:cyclopropane fatty-acyl-phospholipid synthase-like methyltransferase